MLGIGFIITQFVAMQKPQQRKYHSSCNRSVHRGTAHGKQRVKVCKRKTPHLFLMRSFLPPYGDGIYTPKVRDDIFVFSPPYGDSTDFDKYGIVELTFSPPYGDGTESLKLSHGVLKFSPPYGEAGAQRLRGFCRDKLKSALQGLDRQQMTFPSPCGEKL